MTNENKLLGADAAAVATARSAEPEGTGKHTPGPWKAGDAAPDYHVSAYRLAMHVLQSEMYRADPNTKVLVDDVLAIHVKAEGQ